MKTKPPVYQTVLALLLILTTAVITVMLFLPPHPSPITAPATQFSATRAMVHLDIIAQEPHPMGEFEAHAKVRDYLMEEIQAMGLETQIQDSFGVRLVEPGFLLGGAVENVLVLIPGSRSEGTILLIAHYDSTPGGPGAADNGSGVVTLLELIRALQASSPLRHDVLFLFTDGHEPGIIGTHAFTALHPWYEEVKFVINIDNVWEGPPVLVSTSAGAGTWIQMLAGVDAPLSQISLPYHLFPSGDSDLIPFIEAGVPGVSFGSGASSQTIHTALDLPHTVNPRTIQGTGSQVLAVVRYLGNQPSLAPNAPDQTFFPLWGQFLHYPVTWARPLALLAMVLFMAVLWRSLQQKALTWVGMGLGCLTSTITILLSLGLTTLLWLGIQALHPEYAYSAVRPHLSGDGVYAVGLLLLAIALLGSMIALIRTKITPLDLAAGATFLWLPITAVSVWLVPATSYLASWTLMVGALTLGLAVFYRAHARTRLITGLSFLAGALVVTGLWLPAVYVSLIGPGLTMLWLLMGVSFLWLVAMLPAFDWITTPARRALPVASTCLGIGFLLIGHLVVGKQSPPPLVNSLGYWLDAGSKQASWVAFIGGTRTDARTSQAYQVAFPTQMDERQRQILAQPVRHPYTDLFPFAPPFSVLTSPAPLIPYAGPGLKVMGDTWVDNYRQIEARVTTSMHDRLYILIPDGAHLISVTVPDNEKMSLPPVIDKEWVLRFDGVPASGFNIHFEMNNAREVQIFLVEERTGVPTFPGLATQAQPGTMRSPGEFAQGDATDFTAIYREVTVPPLTPS